MILTIQIEIEKGRRADDGNYEMAKVWKCSPTGERTELIASECAGRHTICNVVDATIRRLILNEVPE